MSKKAETPETQSGGKAQSARRTRHGRTDGAVPEPLGIDKLYRGCDAEQFGFETTGELDPIEGSVGQVRALDALAFSASIKKPGFNLFVIGPYGAGQHQAVRRYLEDKAAGEPPSSDWVYVNNFDQPRKPLPIELPAGRATQFADAMADLIEDLRTTLPAVFESEDYETRRNSIDESFRQKQEGAFEKLKKEAEANDVVIVRTPMGFALAPARDGQVIKPEVFNAMPREERRQYEEVIERLQGELEQILKSIPRWDKERREAIKALDRETAQVAVDQLIDELKSDFTDLPEVLEHIETVRKDIVDNVRLFLGSGEENPLLQQLQASDGLYDRYQVNVMVTAGSEQTAPVVEETHPTLANLVGRIEHVARQGTLVTNFLLIRAGALHRANGGYLMIDARAVLTEPFAWSALKRALRAHKIRIESPHEYLGLATTISLEPEPIPLDLKVVIFGDRLLYYLLVAYDPDIADYFKVLADFDDAMDRSEGNVEDYARLIAGICARSEIRPLDREAMARVIEHAARLADDAAKLSLEVRRFEDLLCEADHYAGEREADIVTRKDIDRAIEEDRRRSDRVRERAQEMILRDIAMIDTDGAQVGQVNGLSVLVLGHHAFGRPSRITARVRMGTGKVVDIEREVELGGALHSKGVLILSGFLSARYALDEPLSLSASLVFEQSYGGVEGDSASMAELVALLSGLAEVPIRQNLAITGSVNQHGEMQAIGGVNEKIEGFFEICSARGLSGEQGVVVPASNVQHLMLREDVVAACEDGKFAIYAVDNVDQALSLLTGTPAGDRDEDGVFPEGTVNRAVEDRLTHFARARRAYVARRGDSGVSPEET